MAFSFSLSNSSGVPYYRQIVNQITYGIANGLLIPGQRLPTVRQLAVDLQVNLNTIVKAYSELELRGIVNTQQGTGTFVSEDSTGIDPDEKKKGILRLCEQFLVEVSAMGASTDEVFKTLQKIAAQRSHHQKGAR